jgi:hypothetical protein
MTARWGMYGRKAEGTVAVSSREVEVSTPSGFLREG